MRRGIIIFFSCLLLFLIAPCASFAAQKDSLKVKLNDYSMLGIQYGAGMSRPVFNPVRNQESLYFPLNDVGIIYTKYCKMFGYLSYFGFQGGVFFAQEGYKFKEHETTHYIDNILGASKVQIQTVEVPLMAHFHVDFWKMKIVANLGVYGGYRLNIKRSDYLSDAYYNYFKEYENAFHPNEIKWEYGVKGGAGFAIALDPIEIHLMAWYKYSFALLHQPDVNSITLEHDENSHYYYKWANPTNTIISLGIHYQLSKPHGNTRKELKQQARVQAEEMYDEAVKQHPEIMQEIQAQMDLIKAEKKKKEKEQMKMQIKQQQKQDENDMQQPETADSEEPGKIRQIQKINPQTVSEPVKIIEVEEDETVSGENR